MICIKICLVYYILSKVHIIIPFHESILLGSDRIPIHFGPASIPSVSRQACSKVTAEGHCLGGSAMTWWTLRKWHEMNQQDVFFGSKDRIFMVMYFSFLAMVIYSYGFIWFYVLFFLFMVIHLSNPGFVVFLCRCFWLLDHPPEYWKIIQLTCRPHMESVLLFFSTKMMHGKHGTYK